MQGRGNRSLGRDFHGIIANLAAAGAEAVILGCTEITMIVDPQTAGLPTYDTTTLYARAAVEGALTNVPKFGNGFEAGK